MRSLRSCSLVTVVDFLGCGICGSGGSGGIIGPGTGCVSSGGVSGVRGVSVIGAGVGLPAGAEGALGVGLGSAGSCARSETATAVPRKNASNGVFISFLEK